MNWAEVFVLSVVEGVTEFLPISSTGHMILTAKMMGVFQSEFVKSFEVAIQLGAIMAIAILYRRKLFGEAAGNIWQKILIAFIPTGVFGLLFYKVVKTYLIGSVPVTLGALGLGGAVIIYLEKVLKNGDKKIAGLSLGGLLTIGLFQTISMIPGVSRAAAAIIGGRMAGLGRKEASEFSFFLAIPTMAAATGMDLVKSYNQFSSEELLVLLVGFLGAFVTALITVKWFVVYVKKHDMAFFGWYRIGLAVAYWCFGR